MLAAGNDSSGAIASSFENTAFDQKLIQRSESISPISTSLPSTMSGTRKRPSRLTVNGVHFDESAEEYSRDSFVQLEDSPDECLKEEDEEEGKHEIDSDEAFPSPDRKYKRGKRKSHRAPKTNGEFICLYRWPLEQDGPLCILQDQLIEFLAFKSFKRKYNLERRRVDTKERIYLKSKRKLKPHQICTSSIVLNVNETLDVLESDFPVHCDVLRKRIKAAEKNGELSIDENAFDDNNGDSVLDSVKNEDKTISNLNQNKSRKKSYVVHCLVDEPVSNIEAAQNFNKSLKDRRNVYSKCCNLQTMQLERCRRRSCSSNVEKHVFSFPLRLTPYQYTDAPVKRYTANEQFQLPLNTVIYNTEEAKLKFYQIRKMKREIFANNANVQQSPCSVCNETIEHTKVRIRSLESLDKDPYIQCSTCKHVSHARCIDMSMDMLKIVREYRWQCTSCKNCVICSKTSHKEMLMFCDRCDRAYHSFCMNMQHVTRTKWICPPCFKQSTIPYKLKLQHQQQQMMTQRISVHQSFGQDRSFNAGQQHLRSNSEWTSLRRR